MIGYKTGLACILAVISPVIAAIAGWVWGVIQGTAPPNFDAAICEGCGYDLTGNVSGVCPECGLTIVLKQERTVDVNHPRKSA